MKKLLFTLILAGSIPTFAAESAKKVEAQKPASQELTVGVKGMVCAFCAQGIEKNFKSQKEIETVQVSLENKFVKLKFKEGQKLSNEKIAEILKDAGYEADFKQ
jgi:periplasmic mercuric ion binding protein